MTGAPGDETVQLGASGIRVARLGIGAMSWANRSPLGCGGADSPASTPSRPETDGVLDACREPGIKR